MPFHFIGRGDSVRVGVLPVKQLFNSTCLDQRLEHVLVFLHDLEVSASTREHAHVVVPSASLHVIARPASTSISFSAKLCPRSPRLGERCGSRSGFCQASRSQISGCTRTSSPQEPPSLTRRTTRARQLALVQRAKPLLLNTYGAASSMYPTTGASAAPMLVLGQRSHRWCCARPAGAGQVSARRVAVARFTSSTSAGAANTACLLTRRSDHSHLHDSNGGASNVRRKHFSGRSVATVRITHLVVFSWTNATHGSPTVVPAANSSDCVKTSPSGRGSPKAPSRQKIKQNTVPT